ncbi:MAG TPA: exosortase/archaeosortase family protein [Tepidisphaeraceae bacterium]|jgi:exosortase|nr:exosortase/archaeosortase family protein [Tepidisphaeraceae bacterium]
MPELTSISSPPAVDHDRPHPRARLRNGWTWWHLGGILLFVFAAIVARWEAWQDICRIALRDEESSHILLVPLAVVWLIWVRRRRLRQCRPVPSMVGTILTALGWVISSGGYRADHPGFWHAGSVLMVIGAFTTVAGRDLLLRFLPAAVVLGFLVPMPGTLRHTIAVPLQTWTAHVTQFLLEAGGSTVERHGNLLSINGNGVTIAEACNGMRMVFTLILVSYIFAFTTPLRGYVRALILILSPLTAILCNVIRLVPTVWVYGYASPETANMFHDISGWVMLVVAFLMLMSVVSVLRWAMIPVTEFRLAGEN